MDDKPRYAVFFFPQAIEALGEAIKPYLHDSKSGLHVLCHEVDTGGALVEMTLGSKTIDGEPVELELMVPTSMVRMIVSARGDESFGFGPRTAVPVARLAVVEPVVGAGRKAAGQSAASTPAPAPDPSEKAQAGAAKASGTPGKKSKPQSKPGSKPQAKPKPERKQKPQARKA